METVIRRHIVRRLIWVCTVFLCPTKRMLGLYGLISFVFFAVLHLWHSMVIGENINQCNKTVITTEKPTQGLRQYKVIALLLVNIIPKVRYQSYHSRIGYQTKTSQSIPIWESINRLSINNTIGKCIIFVSLM